MKARKSKSKVKVILIEFLQYSRDHSFRFLTQGQKVNQTVYKEILWRLVRSVRDKRRSLWEANAWALHHNNAPAYTALSICQLLAERNIETLEQPHIGKSECTSVHEWKGITLKDFDFGIFQYFSINFL